MVDGPFSAVNPTRLIRAGLETDLTDQFERGNAVFAKVLHVSESSRVYIATSPIGMHGLKALADDGVSRIVVPESNLQSSPEHRSGSGAMALHALGPVSHPRILCGGRAGRPRPGRTSEWARQLGPSSPTVAS